MKIAWKKFTLEYYLRYMRRQSKHVQNIHAFVFAGTLTSIVAAFILYTDYGFWHETYVSDDLVAEQKTEIESPGESLSNFLTEAKTRFSSIQFSGLLEGKESYVNTSSQGSNSSQK